MEGTLIRMSLRHGILGLLSNRPASGYDLLSTFQETLANVWPATQSQLYGELNRLANDGLIRVTSTGARGRKEYELTDAGGDELHRWLVDVEPKRVNRNDMLLRVFFLGLLTRKEAVAYIENERAVTERYRAELKAIEDGNDWSQGDFAANGRIALEWGLRYTEMQREWADWALDRLAPKRSKD
jgi:DNA-binding PadR family transcriptional regulator